MLSLGGGQWEVWTICCITGVFAVLGGLSGLFSVRLALAYACSMARGVYPDQAAFGRAVLRGVWPLLKFPLARYLRAGAGDDGSDGDCGRDSNRDGCGGGGQASLRYGIAVLMAMITPMLYWASASSVYFVALLVAALALVTLALIDAACGLLPDALTQPLLWGGLFVSWLGYGLALPDAFAGVVLGYGFPWALFCVCKYACGRDAMGYGDFKLLAGLGAWLGWQAVAPVLLMASIGLVGWAMWRQKTFWPAGSYPYGPFLILSAAGVFVTGSGVHSWFI